MRFRQSTPILVALAALALFVSGPASHSLRPDARLVAGVRVCYEGSNSKSCLRNLATRTLGSSNLPVALATLDAAISDPAVASMCHVLGHYLGQEEYRRVGDLGTALGQCDGFCYGSCYHGAAEAYVIDRIASGGYAADDAALAAVAGSVTNCRTASCDERVDTIHGVGHALMFLTANDLPRSLRLCDLASNPTACHIGVFMSNFMSLEDPAHPSAYIRSGDPTFPCRILDGRYQSACYKNQADFLATDDIAQNVELCRKFPELFRESCYLEAPKRLVQKGSDLAAVAAGCVRIGSIPADRLCIEGVVVNLRGKHRDDFRDMAAFCAAVGVGYRPDCYRRIGTVLADWLRAPGNRRDACASITEPVYAEWCRDSAPAP